jgi:hypothetical protein
LFQKGRLYRKKEKKRGKRRGKRWEKDWGYPENGFCDQPGQKDEEL